MSTADEERIKEDMAESVAEDYKSPLRRKREKEAADKAAFEELTEKARKHYEESVKELGNPYAKIEAGLTDEEPDGPTAAEWAEVGYTTEGVTFTGSAAPLPGTPRRITKPVTGHSMSVTSGGGLFGPGGITTSPPFAPYPSTTTTTTGWGTTLPATPPEKTKSKKNKHVRLPPRFTQKVLLAFVDEDDPDETTNVIWAAHLTPEQIEMRLEDGELRLHIDFSLEDHHDNNPED
jgi:hypothetical protein